MMQQKPKTTPQKQDEFGMRNANGETVTAEDIAKIHTNNLLMFYKTKDNYSAALKQLMNDAEGMSQALIWHESELKKTREQNVELKNKLEKLKKKK